MSRLSPIQWLLIAALAVLYVITCVRVARTMKRVGRRPVLWFFLTLFFTAIPASVVFTWHNFAWLRRRDATRSRAPPQGATVRCPRCRRRISIAEIQCAPEPKTCPRCGSLLDQDMLA